jgi:hypothetical protein
MAPLIFNVDTGCRYEVNFTPRPLYCFYFLKIQYLTPWSRVFLENRILPQVIKGISHIQGPLKFITVFTKARHLALS